MASPTCLVKDGAGAYTATTNGNNVTPANTISIQLASVAGVSAWSISCVYTDELSSAATVTAALTIDNLNKIATYTAPTAGRAYIFQSRINGGIDVNGTVQPALTTTLGIYTLAASGNRVVAANETVEGNPTFGYVATINPALRAVAGGGTVASFAVPALAIDWSVSGSFTKTLGAGANTFTFANQASGMVIIVRLTGAASTVVWPTVKWAGGVAPTQTASGTDVYTFFSDGTSIYGSVVQAMA